MLTQIRTTTPGKVFLGTLDVQDNAHAESQPLVLKTLFWKTMDQIVRARISADFGRSENDANTSRHPSRGADPVSG